MSESDINTENKKFHHLNEIQRGQIEILLKMKIPKAQIAKQVGIARSTLYLELKRGTVTQMNSDILQHGTKSVSKASQKLPKTVQGRTGRGIHEFCGRKNTERKMAVGCGVRLRKTSQTFCRNGVHNYILSLH